MPDHRVRDGLLAARRPNAPTPRWRTKSLVGLNA